MTEETSSDQDIDVSLRHLRASRYPILRRLDQQFRAEAQFAAYGEEIVRVGARNRVALSSLERQEERLRALRAALRSSMGALPPSEEEAVTGRVVRAESAEAPVVAASSDAGAGAIGKEALAANSLFLQRTQAMTTDRCGKGLEHQTTSKTGSTPSLPEAPKNFHVTEIRHNSVAVRWDAIDHDETIVDFQVKCCYAVDNIETQILHSCSRWCLKNPVPQGQFTIENLEANTEYDIFIRCRTCHGWSAFSNPVTCLTGDVGAARAGPGHTSDRAADEARDGRRGRFLYRIAHIGRAIKDLDDARHAIPAQQMRRARHMAKVQRRTVELNDEIERVVAHGKDEPLSSDLLHGARQIFSKAVLRRKLEDELIDCRENIAQERAEIIDLDAESGELLARRDAEADKLRERKLALARFDRQRAIVSGMKTAVSKRPHELKRYYVRRWRSRVAERRSVKETLASVARSCRRRICAKAWRRLLALLPPENDGRETDGVGGVLLNMAEDYMQDNVDGVSHLIEHIQENQVVFGEESNEVTRRAETCPSDMLCKEDSASLAKGNFLYKTGHYDSALKVVQLLLSKIEARDCVSSLTPADLASLRAELNGKVGRCHTKLCSFDLALVYFGRQLSLAEEDKFQSQMFHQRAEALMGLGMCYHHKHDHKYAISFFKRALDLCTSKEDEIGNIADVDSMRCQLYKELQTCYVCLNQPGEAAKFGKKVAESDKTSWDRQSGGTAVSRKGVQHALQKLDSMKNRLIDVTAQKAQVVKLESTSPIVVKLLRAKSNKEFQLKEAFKRLSELQHSAEELQELIERINFEIQKAQTTKPKKFVVSRLIQGHNQEIKAAELLVRLQEELKVVENKYEDCLEEIPQTEMLIHNTKDDIAVLKEEITLETCPLMQRVHEGREYRCVSLNSMNLAYDDVTGTSARGIPCVALSEGEDCYVYNLATGKMKHVFVGEGEGENKAIISSLFFYGNYVYTGTMDSIDSTLACWDLSTSEKLFVAKGHEAAVTCICADDQRVFSGGADKAIFVWAATDGTMICRVLGHDRGVHCIQCGASWCVSASFNTVFVWDTLSEKETNNINVSDKSGTLVISCKYPQILIQSLPFLAVDFYSSIAGLAWFLRLMSHHCNMASWK